MEYEDFLKLTLNKPLIKTKDFIDEGPSFLVQLNRWVKSGKLIQLKRGTYILNEIYQKKAVNHFYIANNLVWPSYISLEKALEHWGLIPEAVHEYTSITSKRPQSIKTKIANFSYRNIKSSLFWGYQSFTQSDLVYFIATPEKALLDLFYYHPGQITNNYLDGLRLQNTEILDLEKFYNFALKFKKQKIFNAHKKALNIIKLQKNEYKTL